MPAPCPVEPAVEPALAESIRPCETDSESADAADALRQIVERAEMALAVYTAVGTCVFSTAVMGRTMATAPTAWRQTALWDVDPWRAAGVLHDAVMTLADGGSRTRSFIAPETDRPVVATVHRLRQGPRDLVAVVVGPSRCSHGTAARHAENLVDFASATAHRVNEGLVPATCALELLSAETSDSRVSSMLIAQAMDAIRRVGSGVKEVVEGMEDDIRGSTPFDLIDIIEDLHDSRPWYTRARLFVDREGVRALPRARGSADQIRAAFEQLVDNALEGSEAAPVSIDAACIDIDEPVYVSSGDKLEPGTYAVIAIADDDPRGESNELQQGAQSPNRLGVGLELAKAAKIARDHGGGLDLECTPGGGTTVRLWIPGLVEDVR